jgi:hypothetical protein
MITFFNEIIQNLTFFNYKSFVQNGEKNKKEIFK